MFLLPLQPHTIGQTWSGPIKYSYVMYCTVPYCTLLYYTVLYCIVIYCTVLYCNVRCKNIGIHSRNVYCGFITVNFFEIIHRGLECASVFELVSVCLIVCL